MVGMASVVTRSVPDFALVMGHPARVVGFVDRHGSPWVRFTPGEVPGHVEHVCPAGYRYVLEAGTVTEFGPGDGISP